MDARSALSLAVTTLLATQFAGSSPAAAAPPTPVHCGPDYGQEDLTLEGFSHTFEAPVGTGSAAGDHPYTSRSKWGVFPFVSDFSPYARVTLNISLDWSGTSDFAIYVFDGRDGSFLDMADAGNIGGETKEELDVVVDHCMWPSVRVVSSTGTPNIVLTLDIDVTPSTKLLACQASDPAPGCAGKGPGEAPEFIPDPRSVLYLGGDPGQASMANGLLGNDSLPESTLHEDIPSSGKPNHYTRPLGGTAQEFRNPLVAHWTSHFPAPRKVSGTAVVSLYVSSATEDSTGTLHVALFGDGRLLGQGSFPGDRIREDITGALIPIPIEDTVEATTFTLQVASDPVASTGGPGDAADAHVTLYYGSVQVPARVTLP